MNSKLRFKLLLLILPVLATGVLLVIFRPVRVKTLVIKDVEGQTQTRIPVPDREFTLRFVHSVQQTPVYEIIHITDDNKLVLKETRYYSLGIGLPSDGEKGKFENRKGEFVLKLNREFESINIRASPIPQHSLRIGDNTYPLLDFAEANHLVEIKAANEWTFKKAI